MGFARLDLRRTTLTVAGIDVGDPFGLQRFVLAQDGGNTYQDAIAELRAGRKVSHWMWFVFLQFAGLGRTEMAQTYSITSLLEARAYLRHLVLGPRLVECATVLTELTELVECATVLTEPNGLTEPTEPNELTGLTELSAEEIFGATDAMKLRSSMTLFEFAEPKQPVFARVLDRYYGGVRDVRTERLLAFDEG